MTEQVNNPVVKTISAEQTVRRAETAQVLFLALLLTIPIIGMIFGFLLACMTAGRIFARSAQLGRDLVIAVITTAAAAAAMFLSWAWMFNGGGIYAVIVDFAVNYLVLRRIMFGTLQHVWT